MMNKQKNNGFSLVELLVAASIFVVVLGFVGGTFSVFVGRQKQQIGQELLQQEVQTFLEVIERDVRTAYGDTFNNFDPTSTSNVLVYFMNQEQKFKPTVGERVRHTYYLGDDAANLIGRVYYDDGIGATIPITSDKIDVKKMEFKWNKGIVEADAAGNKYLKGASLRLTIALEVCQRENPTSCLQTQATITSRQTKPIDEK